jgi:hypothetical protein
MDVVSFFLAQHGDLHSAAVAGAPTYADRVLGGLTDDVMRVRPARGLNSMVWLLWHMARVEDVAVNLVVAARPQVLDDAWGRRLGGPWPTIGTGMTDAEVTELSARADVAGVRAYRDAVGLRTRETIAALPSAAWDEIIGVTDTSRAAATGAFGASAGWREDAGFPSWQDHSRGARLAGSALRHNAMHLGEIVTVRSQAGAPVGF